MRHHERTEEVFAPKPEQAAPKPNGKAHDVTPSVIEAADLVIADMPEGVLCGRLGEICHERMSRFPRAYSWPALTTCAGIVANQNNLLRPNLYVALCGPLGSGKTESIGWAEQVLGLQAPEVVNTMAGSVEGLLGHIKAADGAARMYSPDELAHMFKKANIENSTFCQVLNRAFSETVFDLTVAKGKVLPVNCVLSVIGGVVLDDPKGGDNFDECFHGSTIAGTYDRFLFGRCPQPFLFDYRPFEEKTEFVSSAARAGVDPEIWDMLTEWKRTLGPGMGRAGELVLRIASTCAGFDGETLLRVESEYVRAAKVLLEYQMRFRAAFGPNPGTNDDARCSFAILRKLEELAPGGKWVDRRLISKRIHSDRFGPGIFGRAGQNLIFNQEIEKQDDPGSKKVLWRRI